MAKTHTQPAIQPRVKLWIAADDESVFCSGLHQILKAVESTGSIKAAAAQVDRSYRFIWARIKRAEVACGSTLVTTSVGGTGSRRSELTPLAHELLTTFDEFRAELHQLVDTRFAPRIDGLLRKHSQD